jgi:hypothetical protein
LESHKILDKKVTLADAGLDAGVHSARCAATAESGAELGSEKLGPPKALRPEDADIVWVQLEVELLVGRFLLRSRHCRPTAG